MPLLHQKNIRFTRLRLKTMNSVINSGIQKGHILKLVKFKTYDLPVLLLANIQKLVLQITTIHHIKINFLFTKELFSK